MFKARRSGYRLNREATRDFGGTNGTSSYAYRVGFVMRLLRWFVSGLVACSAALLVPIVLSPTMVRAAALGPDEALKNLVGTSWMYGGLWTFVRPDPSDPATVRLRFPAEGKVEVVGPCGSEVGELKTVKTESFSAPWQLVGTFASASAAECPGSPRQGIVGDLIRSGIDGSTNPIQAMFRSKGHTFFEDTATGVSPLAGTSWDVESVDGQPLAPLHWDLEFLSTGVFGGSDGCNGFNGSYVTNGDRLRTTGWSSTAIGCTYHSPLPRPLLPSQNTRFVLAANQLTISEDGVTTLCFG
jgi:META domain